MKTYKFKENYLSFRSNILLSLKHRFGIVFNFGWPHRPIFPILRGSTATCLYVQVRSQFQGCCSVSAQLNEKKIII